MTADKNRQRDAELGSNDQTVSEVDGPDSIGPILEMLDDLRTYPADFQAEQELILTILERKGGSAHLQTIAGEMGSESSEIAVPIDLLQQSDIVDVSGSGIQLTVTLID